MVKLCIAQNHPSLIYQLISRNDKRCY
uniref:Uncharacterized protein n=1 Tax=Arundo donax TaxID=35708 RepID=A0A0A8YK21_ARUDO